MKSFFLIFFLTAVTVDHESYLCLLLCCVFCVQCFTVIPQAVPSQIEISVPFYFFKISGLIHTYCDIFRSCNVCGIAVTLIKSTYSEENCNFTQIKYVNIKQNKSFIVYYGQFNIQDLKMSEMFCHNR